MKKKQEIYDLYWYFAYERQNIFWNKLNGKKAPGLIIRYTNFSHRDVAYKTVYDRR